MTTPAGAGNKPATSRVPPGMPRKASSPLSLRDVVSVAAAAAVVLTARSSLADHYVVPSGSMLPTVQLADRILVDKTAFGLRVPFTHTYVTGHGPSRSDVVVLSSPDDGTILLKRVVAVPGDVVRVHQGRLVLNGNPVPVLAEEGRLVERLDPRPHPIDLSEDGGPDFGPVVVPAGRYLVLGDNRANSRDGRFFGWVAREGILGRAVGVVWRDGRPSWIAL